MTKYVCIESAYYGTQELELKKINIGEVFEVELMNLRDGYSYSQESEVKFISKILSSYFITLAEWREKQIDQILDEKKV